MKVLVLLPRALDVTQWRREFADGRVPDETPYGYHHAEAMGCKVEFSSPTATPAGPLGFFDRAVKKVLGFDLRHVWNNRRAVFDGGYDVIWTHTEFEHLGVLALGRVFGWRFPPLIAQSIWLIDDWFKYSAMRRGVYRWLLARADVLSFHSPLNTEEARRLNLGRSQALVRFGISLDSFPLKTPRKRERTQGPIRVLAMGNDKHRDWATFARALGGKAEFEVRVGSRSFPADLVAENFQVGAMTQAEVRKAYEWADCVVIPLKRNLHVSGSTTVLEAVASGVPVVLTDCGGLRAYFGDNHVRFSAEGDAEQLRSAVVEVAANPDASFARARNAQSALIEEALTTKGFADRHVALSSSAARREKPPIRAVP